MGLRIFLKCRIFIAVRLYERMSVRAGYRYIKTLSGSYITRRAEAADQSRSRSPHSRIHFMGAPRSEFEGVFVTDNAFNAGRFRGD